MTRIPDPPPLSPLRFLFWGVLLAALDLNVGVVDVLPDVLGYLLVLLGLHRLAPLHRAFARARAAAVVGGVAALLVAVLRRTEETVTGGGPLTTTTSRLVEPLWPTVLEALAQAALVVLVCTALIALVPSEARPARFLRVFLPLVALVGAALAVGARLVTGEVGDVPVSGPPAVPVLALVVVGLGLTLWFLVVLSRASRASAAPAEPALR